MNAVDPQAAAYYTAYKQQWDTLPEQVKKDVDAVLPQAVSTDKIFNLAYILGFNEALNKVLGLLTFSANADPGNTEIKTTKDIVMWVTIRLFLVQYETLLLEQLTSGTLH